ncbi:MAG TPA: hypothetical protein VGN48_03110 [Pedococcus sp.]|nr:hypothetical protein [Pedococcus sp.]
MFSPASGDPHHLVGWQVSQSLRTDLALDALEMGLRARRRDGYRRRLHSEIGTIPPAGYETNFRSEPPYNRRRSVSYEPPVDPARNTGALRHSIPVRGGPHGLLVWPQPCRFSLGHIGNMR